MPPLLFVKMTFTDDQVSEGRKEARIKKRLLFRRDDRHIHGFDSLLFLQLLKQ